MRFLQLVQTSEVTLANGACAIGAIEDIHFADEARRALSTDDGERNLWFWLLLLLLLLAALFFVALLLLVGVLVGHFLSPFRHTIVRVTSSQPAAPPICCAAP